jgi:hypothetical protein
VVHFSPVLTTPLVGTRSRHGPDRTRLCTSHWSVRPPRIRKKRLAKNQILVYFSYFIYLEIRKKHFAHESRTNHGDIPNITTMASGATVLNQNSEFCADTLHVVGSWYAPTTCKVSALRMARSRSEKKKVTLIILCALPGSWGRTR